MRGEFNNLIKNIHEHSNIRDLFVRLLTIFQTDPFAQKVITLCVRFLISHLFKKISKNSNHVRDDMSTSLQFEFFHHFFAVSVTRVGKFYQ